MNLRYLKGKIVKTICGAAAFFAAGMLIFIIVDFFLKGIASLNLHFILFTEINSGMGLGTGIANAIVGTILLGFLATLIAFPFAIGTAIYLQRYAPENKFTRFLRLMIEVLSGTPSIILGIVALFILVVYLKPITGGESLLAGSIALAALILPVIERTTEDAISRVPSELEEGSYSLGATKWLTIKNITIPYAFSGIVIGAILGFGRAAEESAIVIVTAGYSQYMPEFKIVSDPHFLLGVKIFPLNNLVGSLPIFIYTSYENSNVFPVSSIFAAGFILIMILVFVNLSAKAILFYATAATQGRQDDPLSSLFGHISNRFRQKEPESMTMCSDVNLAPPINNDSISSPEDIRTSEILAEPAPDRQNLEGTAHTFVDPAPNNPENLPQPRKKPFSAGTRIGQLSRTLHQKISSLVHINREKKTPANADMVQRIEDLSAAAAVKGGQPFPLGKIIGLIRTFLLTVAPFLLIAAVLMVLTLILPALSPVGSNGPAGFLTVPLMTLIICIIGTVCALFLVRNSTLFLLRRQKGKMGNRRAEFAAVVIGVILILFGAFIFSAHIFAPIPSIQSQGSEKSTGTGIFSYFAPAGNGGFSGVSNLILNNSLFSFVYNPGMATTPNTMDTTNRSARLAALLASEEIPTEVTTQSTPVASQTSVASSPSAAVSSPGSIVPVKNALDIGESYWYGDNSRPCLATIYNATTMPLYFYWDIDWNRFVQVTPASSGDTFLVIFIRIEDTGNMSAIVPPAAQYVVYYKGQAYYNEPYFDTSVLDANEISIYTANFNLLPYQWIREIGQQKRDYAFLTGYNIFGQNTTVISNYSANNQFTPPTANTPNGEGWFIKPGRSNAIDGYLIYEVPGAVATDLKDTYVQVPFNSFSSTQWRLGK